jgi:hypothetical protein
MGLLAFLEDFPSKGRLVAACVDFPRFPQT